jgi:hypothetical protein
MAGAVPLTNAPLTTGHLRRDDFAVSHIGDSGTAYSENKPMTAAKFYINQLVA